MERKRYSLDGLWGLCFTSVDDGNLIETDIAVPSNIEPTLVKLGLIEDYLPADDEYATEKFEQVDDWTYTKIFDMPPEAPGSYYELVFEGIDTIAQIYLNGEMICDCMNMHMTYRIDVSGKLKTKGNVLKVVIRSSILWAREHCHDMMSLPHGMEDYYDTQPYLRKARHQWGWDNAPRLLTSGIFRSVYVEQVPERRLEDVYIYTVNLTESEAQIRIYWTYRTPETYLKDHVLKVTVSDGDHVITTTEQKLHYIQGSKTIRIPRSEISLWWPNGFGEPKLYNITLEVLAGGQPVACYQSDFGIRKLSLDRTEDILEDGTGEFVFVVNGEKLYIRGTNWKPLDPLASEADRKMKNLEALQEILKLNCNMVRVWGGGIYEDTEFFDFCDRNGILIWQDFMFACELTPSDDWFCKLVAQEAEQVIKKYRNHPSLAVWCGDNENDECLMWKHLHSTIRPSDYVISRKILKEAVLRFDPYRPYVESSPYASDANFEDRRSGKMTHFQPEYHLYPNSVFFAKSLRELKSKFIGETGPMQVNPIIVNEEVFQREQPRLVRLWDSEKLPGNDSHQSDAYFSKWRNASKELCLHNFGREFKIAEWKDYTLAVNLSCAEIFKDAIEFCRVTRWEKTGVIWWSLADMWPMLFNYSVMDWQLNKKLPYFWIRQSQQEVVLSAVRKELGGALRLYAVNDTLQKQTVTYSVTTYDEKGIGSLIAESCCSLDKNSVSELPLSTESGDPQLWIIRWLDGERDYTNHAFTGFADYETMRRWVGIIGSESGYLDEILELK